MGDPNNPTSAPDTPVQQPADNGPVNNPGIMPSVSNAIGVYIAAVLPYVTSLRSALLGIDPADASHHAKVGTRRQQVITMTIAMLRTVPSVSAVSADTVAAAMSDVAACTGLVQTLQGVINALNSTSRLRLEYAWTVCSGAIATARKLAPRNAAVATAVAAIDADLALGSKATQAGHVAVDAQDKAIKATARATKAEQTAATATARATALQHGTGDATITQSAPSAPAASTTAPASAPSTTIR